MARLRDFSPVVRRLGFIAYCKRVWQQCLEDGLFTWASALAYSWLFAIFPFFVFLLSLMPYIPNSGKEWVEHNLGGVLQKSLPMDAYKTVWEGYLQDRIGTLLHSRPKGFLSVGLLLALWAASGGMAMTVSALDKAYDLERCRPWWRVRVLAIFLTFIVASLLLAAMVLLPVASTAKEFVQNFLVHLNPPRNIPVWAYVIFDILRYAVALACLFAALAVLYYFGPFVKQRFRWLTPGAVFCVCVWLLLGWVFRLYVNHFGRYQQMYGPVGGVVILLLFFYLDAVVLLIGAEINSEIDFVAYNVKPGCRDFRGVPWEQEHLPQNVEPKAVELNQ
jgi:membrane protein